MGNRKIHIGFWLGSLKERDYQEELDVRGKTILNCILRKYDGSDMNWIDLGQEGSCESSGSVNWSEILEYQLNCDASQEMLSSMELRHNSGQTCDSYLYSYTNVTNLQILSMELVT
jgi:hypothetical protein